MHSGIFRKTIGTRNFDELSLRLDKLVERTEVNNNFRWDLICEIKLCDCL